MDAKVKSRRYSAEEWEAQKPNIERLYVIEGRPLKEVIEILSRELGFSASPKQLKSKNTKWGFDVKNIKGETMVQLARTKSKRKLENKKSSFRVNKKAVDDSKIDRYMRRNDLSEEKLLQMRSPVDLSSPAFSVFTPDSVRSPMSSINFQTLSLVDPRPNIPPNLLIATLEKTMATENDASRPSSSLALTRAAGTATKVDVNLDDMSQVPLLPPATPLTGEGPINPPSTTDQLDGVEHDSVLVLPNVPSINDALGLGFPPLEASNKFRRELPVPSSWAFIGFGRGHRIPAVPLVSQFKSIFEGISQFTIPNLFDDDSTVDLNERASKGRFLLNPNEIWPTRPEEISDTWIWTCASCEQLSVMTTHIEHCSECGRLCCAACFMLKH